MAHQHNKRRIRGEQGNIRMGFTLIGTWSRKVGVQNTPSWTSLINSMLDKFDIWFLNLVGVYTGIETNEIWEKSW